MESSRASSSRRSRSPRREESRESRRHRSRSPIRERSRSRDRSRDRHRERNRSRSPRRRDSRSASPNYSKSSSKARKRDSRSPESESDSSRRHKSSKSKSRSKEEKKEKEEKKLRKELREEKKERIAARARRKAGLGKQVEWGKYGILVEADIYNKDQEFRAWLVEEQTLNPETISKHKLKEEFKVFMEYYNTATFSHDKFYDLTAYEQRLRAIANGETVTTSTTYDHRADEASIKSAHKRKIVEQDTFLDRGRLVELAKVQSDRIIMERMAKMGMVPKAGMGVRTEEKDNDMGGGA